MVIFDLHLGGASASSVMAVGFAHRWKRKGKRKREKGGHAIHVGALPQKEESTRNKSGRHATRLSWSQRGLQEMLSNSIVLWEKFCIIVLLLSSLQPQVSLPHSLSLMEREEVGMFMTKNITISIDSLIPLIYCETSLTSTPIEEGVGQRTFLNYHKA